MADSRRGISWSLERPCPLRRGDGWERPDVTRLQLADLTSYSNAIHDQRVVDDVCVTSWTHGSDGSNSQIMLPSSGFRVSEALAAFGGEHVVRESCTGCEANVHGRDRVALAGCHGFLGGWPGSESDTDLRERILALGIDAAVDRLFMPTTPLWYGLWIKSPLRRSHCELLLTLFEGTVDPVDPRGNAMRAFLAALRAAVAWELPLHVSMAPPGHADLGWHTVFPHCPRCKAPAPVARWQESYSEDALDCPVCEYRYSPAATHKAERMNTERWDAARLEQVLGASAFEAFQRRFLVHRGHEAAQIDAVIDRQKHGPLKRRINALRRQQAEVRRALPRRETPRPLPVDLTLDLGGSVSMQLRLVSAGEFSMGSTRPPEEDQIQQPRHQVKIERPFYLGEFPVTHAQLAAVTGHEPSRFATDLDLPADLVSWFAAQEFCLTLSRTTGRWVRLPSEAEWEYACRAGTTTIYHWGDLLTPEQANVVADRAFGGFASGRATTVRGRYPPNAWGFFDMHGNVQEWCEDEWHDGYAKAPTDGSAWITPGDESPFRPLRGGACWMHATACTSASRMMLRADSHDEPDTSEDDSAFNTALRDTHKVGFRIVVEVD